MTIGPSWATWVQGCSVAGAISCRASSDDPIGTMMNAALSIGRITPAMIASRKASAAMLYSTTMFCVMNATIT